METDQTKITPSTIEADKTIGIDLGLSHFLIQSDGQKIENPRYLRQAQNRLAIQQKIFARKKKESKGYQRQKLSVARIYEKVRLQRLDLHHKLTHHLICENQATTYAVEDLGIKNMVKNRNLAKSISDVAWGQFLTLLEYKAQWYGKNILKIGRFMPSSKTCSCCGYKVEKLPLSVRSWNCPSCKEFLCHNTCQCKCGIERCNQFDYMGRKDSPTITFGLVVGVCQVNDHYL